MIDDPKIACARLSHPSTPTDVMPSLKGQMNIQKYIPNAIKLFPKMWRLEFKETAWLMKAENITDFNSWRPRRNASPVTPCLIVRNTLELLINSVCVETSVWAKAVRVEIKELAGKSCISPDFWTWDILSKTKRARLLSHSRRCLFPFDLGSRLEFAVCMLFGKFRKYYVD